MTAGPPGLAGQSEVAAASVDLAEIKARFGAALRLAGLPVGAGRCERFASAVAVAQPRTKRALYMCALATLVSSKDHALILRAVFDQVFGGLTDLPENLTGPEGADWLGGTSGLTEDLLTRAALAARRHTPADQSDFDRSQDADGEDGFDS